MKEQIFNNVLSLYSTIQDLKKIPGKKNDM